MEETYIKLYSSALDRRSDEQKTKAKEVQERVKRTLGQKARMDIIMSRYINKFINN